MATKTIKKKASALDLGTFNAVDTANTRTVNSSLSFSMVNTKKHGRRIKLSKSLMEKLGNPEQLQMLIGNGKFVVASHISDELETFTFSPKDPCIIYNSGLVSGLTKALNISFEKRTSVSFTNIRIRKAKYEGVTTKVAEIRVATAEQE